MSKAIRPSRPRLNRSMNSKGGSRFAHPDYLGSRQGHFSSCRLPAVIVGLTGPELCRAVALDFVTRCLYDENTLEYV